MEHGTPSTVQWALTHDGEGVSVSLDGNGGQLTFEAAGAYDLTATATDELGKEFTATLSIEVYPVIVLTLDAPETTHVDQSAAVTLTGTDLDVAWEVTSEVGTAIENSLTNEGGSVKFTQTGTNVLTASVTDGLGRAFAYEQTIEVYPVLYLKLTADAATHTDEQISVMLEKDTALPVTWKITPSNDPHTDTACDGNLTDNGGTIQITSAGTYDIAASVMDATGRVFTAPAVSVMVYPVAGLDFTLPAAAWTDSSTPVDLLTSDLQEQDVTWTLTKDGTSVSLTENMLGDLENLGGKVRFPEVGTYTLTASAKDDLGREYSCSQTIKIYPVVGLTLTTSDMGHIDSVVTLVTGFEELGENPLRWSLTRNGENVPVSDYVTGELTAEGSKVQFKQAGEYKLRASFKDAGGRSYSYEQAFTVYPIPVVAWTMPNYAHTDGTFTMAVESKNVVEKCLHQLHDGSLSR